MVEATFIPGDNFCFLEVKFLLEASAAYSEANWIAHRPEETQKKPPRQEQVQPTAEDNVHHDAI